MSVLITPKRESEIRKLTVGKVRDAYIKLAEDYNRVLTNDVLLCPMCNDWQKASIAFYADKNYATERYPICKKCILQLVEQRSNDREAPNETKESVQKVLQMMDRVYDDGFYEECVKGVMDDVKQRTRSSPFMTYITSIQSLPNWKGKTWKDSNFGSTESVDPMLSSKRQPRKEIVKLFGNGFSTSEYLYLQDQYDDWCARTQVDSKSQQTYIIRICHKLLDIWKAEQKGDDTTKLDESLNKLMEAAKLQPKQNVSNAATDSLTFGQLIERWEQEEPIPEPDPELVDPSNIGKNLRVWFAGWLGHALGLNIPQTQEYEEEVSKYTVMKPDSSEEGTSSAVYGQLFGTGGE